MVLETILPLPLALMSTQTPEWKVTNRRNWQLDLWIPHYLLYQSLAQFPDQLVNRPCCMLSRTLAYSFHVQVLV